MTAENKKGYKVCVQWDVQKTYYVQAKNEDEAQEIYYKGISNTDDENWDYPEILECEEV